MQQPEITLQSLDIKLEKFFGRFQQFAATVVAKFAAFDKRFNSLEAGHQEVMEFMRDNLVIHEELDEGLHNTETKLLKAIGSAKHEIMDYVDKKDALYKGELISSLRKEDVKVDQTIIELEKTRALSITESERLRSLGPFTSLEAHTK